MDTVYYVVLRPMGQPVNEKYLMTDWGDLRSTEVQNWVRELKTGFINSDGSVCDVCEFDQDNLIWSAEMIKNSITVKLWEEIESDFEYGATGPEIFVAVLDRFQHSSSSAA